MRKNRLTALIAALLLLGGCSRPEFRPGAWWTDTDWSLINAH